MALSDQDYRSFLDFEKTAWVKLTPAYDSLVGQTTRQAVEAIIGAVDAGAGSSLLDVATGLGYVAAAAERRGARSLGVDFSLEMIAEAQKLFPGLSIRFGDAENLDFDDAAFDGVTCAFGMLHFARPGRAIAEAYRVLKPGGRYAFTVWSDPTKAKLFGLIGGVMQKYADLTVKVPAGPGAFMLSDPLICMALMDAAGFAEVRAEELPCRYKASSPDAVLEFMQKCAPRASYVYDRQTPEVQEQIKSALLDAGEQAMAEDGGNIPCPAILLVGRKGLAAI